MKRARGMRSWGPASRDSEQNTKKNKRAKKPQSFNSFNIERKGHNRENGKLYIMP